MYSREKGSTSNSGPSGGGGGGDRKSAGTGVGRGGEWDRDVNGLEDGRSRKKRFKGKKGESRGVFTQKSVRT